MISPRERAVRPSAPHRSGPTRATLSGRGVAAAAGVAALALAAVLNHRAARAAERAHPPLGRFLEVDGVLLHCLERGDGPPLVLLHGNATQIEDFVASGMVDTAARGHRVIALDRPGFGHTARLRGTLWTDEAQANLVARALERLGVSRATVLGHSWGCSVAVALARRHPGLVGALVLVSGYFYPTARGDVIGPSLLTAPLLGDALRHTVAPLMARAQWPLARRALFDPAPVPESASGLLLGMAVRPSQIRASAEDAALMVPDAARAEGYRDLTLPVAIVAGAGDRIVDSEAQSMRLHGEVAGSTLERVEGHGHMVHHTAPDRVLAAIARVSRVGRAEQVPVAA